VTVRVLLCDDNPDVIASLALLLESEGVATALSHAGRTCIDKARQWRPHLVFIDIGLPDMTGYEVAREIRQMDFGNDVTLVAYTGYGEAEDVQRAAQAGFDTHMKKGTDPVLLVELATRLKPNRP
jgi:CheY-like chemotaxis protein